MDNNSEDYSAPFRYTYGATVKNLITTGTINTSNKHAGGVVGRNGTARLTLENVKSDVTINSTYNGSAEHGGLVGYAINADLIGCVFTGSILGENSTGCGGLIGWKTGTTGSSANLTDCLFAPANITVGNTNAYTFAGLPSDSLANFTNCYYTQPFGTEQGKQAYSITCANNDITLNFAGAATENEVSGITSYANNHGFLYNDGTGSTLIAGNGDNVSLKLTAPAGYFINSATYTPAGGTATEMAFANGGYSFTMPDTNVVINADMTACGTISLNAENDYTVFEDFESYTSDIHLYTFVTPDCWEVISEDVALSSATKPQLYGGFNMEDGELSDAGSYSLRLKNRCVYAMPALSESFDIHELTMTFSLRQTKFPYRLQVGVVNNDVAAESLNIEVYPNPTKDVVNVQCTMNNVQCSGIEIIDIYGKIITTVGTRFIASDQTPVQINVSGLAAGMYFVRVTTDRGVVTKPFVKK